MSFWKVSTSCSRALSSPLPPSCMSISFNLFTIVVLIGLWNFTSRQWPASDLIFSLDLSLQMHIIGTLLDFIIFMIAAMPPRSPELIPSTSSIIINGLVNVLDMPMWWELAYRRLTPDLFLTSLALNSVTENLYYDARRRAVVVFPIPGSPLRRAALELIEPAALHPLVYLA